MTRSPGRPSPAAVAHSGGKTRRRGEALESALLDAAWDELQAAGYAGLTFEAVADRAGTSRAVLYRRWRNRADLVVAAARFVLTPPWRLKKSSMRLSRSSLCEGGAPRTAPDIWDPPG